MRIFYKHFFVTLLSILMTAVGYAAPARLAIIDTSPQAEFETSIISELSKAEGIELVERAEIDKVLREHALSMHGDLKDQLSVASILHADGLLIFDKITLKEGEALSVRLTASGPGAVIGSAIFALRKDDPASLAKDIIARFEPLWAKLQIIREQALPVSLLNLRCPVKSAFGEKLESQMTFLFANRLIAQPEIFVLERWRLSDVAFEKAFEHVDEGTFWNGSYVVDGEVQISGTASPCKVSVKVFARLPGGKDVKTVEATGMDDKLPELATELATKLVKLFEKQPVTAAWNPLEESREYLREADWAYNNKLIRVARASLDASVALGNRDPKSFKLGAKIYSQLAFSTKRTFSRDYRFYITDEKDVDVAQEPKRIHYAQLALDNLRELLKTPREDPPDDKTIPYWEVANDRRGHIGNLVFHSASLVLKNGYEHDLRNDPALAEIRASIREMYPILVKWRERKDEWPGEHPEKIASVFYPYWFESPEEQLNCCRDLLRHQPIRNVSGDMITIRAYLMRSPKVIEKVGAIPHLLSWKGSPAEELEPQWDQLVQSLLASSDKLERIDGMLLEISKSNAAVSDRDALVKQTLEACWEARDELIAANRMEAVIGNLVEYFYGENRKLLTDARAIFTTEIYLKWLIYFLEHSDQEDLSFVERFWTTALRTEKEAASVYKPFLEYRERLIKGNKNVRFLEEREQDLLRHYPQLHPPLPEYGLNIAEFHPLPGLDAAKSGAAIVHMARCADKLWVCVTSDSKDFHGGIYGLDPVDFSVKESIDVPEAMAHYAKDYDRFFACDAALYYLQGNGFQRYDRKKQDWTAVNLPATTPTGADLQPIGDDVFVIISGEHRADGVSGIWKWTASTGEFKIISNNRRRPAQNFLDDRQEYINSRLFLGPEGRLGARVNFFGFLFDPTATTCEIIKGTESCSFYSIPCDGYTIILSENGSAGLIDTRKGKDVEWLSSVTPTNTAENAGLMLTPFKYAVKHGTNKLEGTVGYCAGKLWYCLPRQASLTQFHLLRCLDWAHPDQPAPPVSVEFELPRKIGPTPTPTPHPKTGPPSNVSANGIPDVINLIALEKGVILWENSLPGFWYVSTQEVEDAQRKSANANPGVNK